MSVSENLINRMAANIMTLNHVDKFLAEPNSQLIENTLAERSESIPKDVSNIIIEYIIEPTNAVTKETIAKRSELIPREISQIILGYTDGKFKVAADVAERILHIYTDIIGEERQATPQEQQVLRDLRNEYNALLNRTGIGMRLPNDSEMEVNGKTISILTGRTITRILEETNAIPSQVLFLR